MKKIAVVQSNYVPWRGYFDLIDSVDEFVLYDDVQYTKRDWRNRNVIKTATGLQWLTVPVLVKGKYHQRIRDTQLNGMRWIDDHWKALEQNYARARCFEEIAEWLEPLYRGRQYQYLSDLNRQFLVEMCRYLKISTSISSSADYQLVNEKSERLAHLCVQAGADEYVSGPSAKAYLDEGVFEAEGVQVSWFEYGEYPEYLQLWGSFEPRVSILDLLFNCGPDSIANIRKQA